MEATPAPSDSGSDRESSVDEDESPSAASGGGFQPRNPSRESAGATGRRPDQQHVKSMPLWREATWGGHRVNARRPQRASPRVSAADDGSSADGGSFPSGASTAPLPFQQPSNSSDGARSPRPATSRNPFVRRTSQQGPSSQPAWGPSSSRRGSNASRPDEALETGVSRQPGGERSQRKLLAESDAEENRGSSSARSSGRPPLGSESNQHGSARQMQSGEARRRRQHGDEEETAASAERRPARRNPGIPWEAKIVGRQGVPLLFVLPEDEQQGADPCRPACCVAICKLRGPSSAPRSAQCRMLALAACGKWLLATFMHLMVAAALLA